MGADVMRLLFCAQVPSQNIRFGYGPAREIKRRLLTLWNSVSFFVTYANIEGYRPSYADLEAGPQTELRTLDRWLVARTQQLVDETTTAYESFWTPGVTRAFDAFVDDLSNWYIRRSRRRFYEYDDAAFRTLWYALVQSLRVIAPVMPFLSEQLWRNLVARPCEDAPRSIFLRRWPETGQLQNGLLEEVAAARRVVELGRQARSTSGLKHRQPLRRLVVQGATLADAHMDEVAEELRVKAVEFGDIDSTELLREAQSAPARPEARQGARRGASCASGGRLRGARRWPLPRCRSRARPRRGARRAARARGLGGRRRRTASPWRSKRRSTPSSSSKAACSTSIHQLNSMRKDAGFAVTDRISRLAPALARRARRAARRVDRARGARGRASRSATWTSRSSPRRELEPHRRRRDRRAGARRRVRRAAR